MSPRTRAYLERYRAEPPTGLSPRRLNFYGHFRRKEQAKAQRVNREHARVTANYEAEMTVARTAFARFRSFLGR